MSLLRTNLSLARASIRRNRARSFLTCLGIAIGVASITLILSLTGSISHLISTELDDVSSDLIVVRPTSTRDAISTIVDELTTPNLYQKSLLSLSDVDRISAVDGVSAVAPISISTNTIADEQNYVTSATILGTTPDLIKISDDLSLRHGTFLTEDNRTNAVVVGHMLSLLLFNTSNPVGRTLTFQGQRFIVVGVLAEANSTMNLNNIDYDHALIMDITILSQLLGTPQIQQIDIRTAETAVVSSVALDVTTAIRENHAGDTNFSVVYGDTLTHPSSNLLAVISGILALIAGISLVVGGISVMNIMLVGVAERTHEIGIRKSIGASSQQILTQFVAEAVMLSLLGGILGIILGYLFAFFISLIMPIAPYFSLDILLVAMLVSILVGVVFGTYPALRAACEDPIDALRHNR